MNVHRRIHSRVNGERKDVVVFPLFQIVFHPFLEVAFSSAAGVQVDDVVRPFGTWCPMMPDALCPHTCASHSVRPQGGLRNGDGSDACGNMAWKLLVVLVEECQAHQEAGWPTSGSTGPSHDGSVMLANLPAVAHLLGPD